jgi:hypothetical protein
MCREISRRENFKAKHVEFDTIVEDIVRSPTDSSTRLLDGVASPSQR